MNGYELLFEGARFYDGRPINAVVKTMLEDLDTLHNTPTTLFRRSGVFTMRHHGRCKDDDR